MMCLMPDSWLAKATSSYGGGFTSDLIQALPVISSVFVQVSPLSLLHRQRTYFTVFPIIQDHDQSRRHSNMPSPSGVFSFSWVCSVVPKRKRI